MTDPSIAAAKKDCSKCRLEAEQRLKRELTPMETDLFNAAFFGGMLNAIKSIRETAERMP